MNQAWSQWVTRQREDRRMSQLDLAYAVQVHPSYINQWERKGRVPSVRILKRLATIFHLPSVAMFEVAGLVD